MKKVMKKISVLLLTSTLLMALVACGQQNTQEETIEVTKEASQEMENTVVEDAVANVSTEEVDGELILDYEEELQYAKNFTLTHYKGGYKMFTIPEAMGDNQYLLV